jgi:hypothetical protein
MERIWANLNELTQFAVVIISLIAVGFHVRWTRRNTTLGPTFLTTLGIFFCFTGIAWGLLNFDPGDIRSSIPHLLEGIRTSFWASVVGIFWALTLKARVALMGDAALPGTGGERGATVGDLADHLARLSQGMQESNERLERLNVSFERYNDKIVAANAQALTAALQTVVQEFNTQVQTTTGLPMIEQSITEMTRQIQQVVTANHATLGTILSASAESMQSYNQQLTRLLSDTIETANRDLGSHLRRAAEDAGKHVVALDRALEEELTRSIESLGRQLTALSQKFVQDYTPLTVSLQRLVHGARA